MGKADIATRKYLEDPLRFADVFNFAIYGGEQVIKAQELRPLESVSVFTLPSEKGASIERRRDGLRAWNAMADGHATYALLGIENQTYVDAGMSVRSMLYDALTYQKQIDELRRKNRKKGLRGDEFLSGLRKSDKLLPVVTLVVYFGQERWDGPTSLHGLLRAGDARLLALVPDYRMNLISPAAMSADDFNKFKTELGLVLGYIKYAGSKDDLRNFVMGNERYRSVDVESANLVNTLTDSHLKVEPGERTVDMCQAIQDIRQEGVDEGIQQGMQQGMLKAFAGLVQDGVLTLAEAAGRAGLSPEEFAQKAASL